MFSLDENFLAELFKFSLKSVDNFRGVSEHLRENFIPNDLYKAIWTEIKIFFQENEKLPKLNHLHQIFLNKKNANKGVVGVLNQIEDCEIDEENLIKIFEDFIKRNMFIQVFNGTSDLFNKGKTEEAYSFYSESVDDFKNFSLSESVLPRVFNDYNKRNIERASYFHTNKQIQIPTGIDFIDRDSYGGFWTGETELWLGDSGSGKSKLLTTRGLASARRGFNVLHVQAEGTEEQCFTNYDACWSGAKYMDIKMGVVEDEKIASYSKVAKQLINTHKSDIHVLCGKKFGDITINTIRRKMLQLRKMGIFIQHIVIDYLELIGLDDGKKYDFEAGERLKQLELARQFKNLAMEFNCLVSTATQSHTIKPEHLNDPDFLITRFNLGNATRKVEPFSYFLTINRTRDEVLAQTCRIWADKYRELVASKVYHIAQNLGASRFYDRKKTIEMFLNDEDFI